MSDETGQAEKEHEPSHRKLQQARRQGDVPKSSDLNLAAIYSGLLLVVLGPGVSSFQALGGMGTYFLENASTISFGVPFGRGPTLSNFFLWQALTDASLWFLIPATMALLSLILQQGITFTPSKLGFKMSRISPAQIAKQKFGRTGLFEFFKSSLKLSLIILLVSILLYVHFDQIVFASTGTIEATLIALYQMTITFLGAVVALYVVIGAVDYVFQRFDYLQRNRMSHREVKDEAKEAEGDPHIKQQRRQKAIEIASNRMLQDVPTASVVIVNPTHFAVALKCL